jgi:hypothetical protein
MLGKLVYLIQGQSEVTQSFGTGVFYEMPVALFDERNHSGAVRHGLNPPGCSLAFNLISATTVSQRNGLCGTFLQTFVTFRSSRTWRYPGEAPVESNKIGNISKVEPVSDLRNS